MASNKPTAAALAAAYINGAAVVPTAAELADLRAWIAREFSLIPVPVTCRPYDIPLAQCKEFYNSERKLYISTIGNNHPWLTSWQNIQFRAVHDWHHICANCDDSLNGEIQAYWHAIKTAPMSILWMLRSEIVLQAAAAIVTGEFQPQKFVRAEV